jgi:hypothetical protein
MKSGPLRVSKRTLKQFRTIVTRNDKTAKIFHTVVYQ